MAKPPAIQKVEGAALAVITATEIDRQVATAKQYPRDKDAALTELRELVTSSPDIALACFYTLERESKDKDTGRKTKSFIVGPSVRFAELLVYCWTNLRVAVRLVEEGAEFLTAQGIAHDLERNNAVSVEVRRRITTSTGFRYGADMIGVTGAAASSIAWRNAVFDLIPPAVWQKVYEAARAAAVGDKSTVKERLAKAIETFVKAGATEAHIYPALGIETRDDLVVDHLIILAGLWKRVLDKEIDASRIFHPDAGEERERIGLSAAAPNETPALEGEKVAAAQEGEKVAAGSRAKPGGDNSTPSTTKAADKSKTKTDPAAEDSAKAAEKKAEAFDDADREAVRVDLELVASVETAVAAIDESTGGDPSVPIVEAIGALRMIAEHSPSVDAKARAVALLGNLPKGKN